MKGTYWKDAELAIFQGLIDEEMATLSDKKKCPNYSLVSQKMSEHGFDRNSTSCKHKYYTNKRAQEQGELGGINKKRRTSEPGVNTQDKANVSKKSRTGTKAGSSVTTQDEPILSKKRRTSDKQDESPGQHDSITYNDILADDEADADDEDDEAIASAPREPTIFGIITTVPEELGAGRSTPEAANKAIEAVTPPKDMVPIVLKKVQVANYLKFVTPYDLEHGNFSSQWTPVNYSHAVDVSELGIISQAMVADTRCYLDQFSAEEAAQNKDTRTAEEKLDDDRQYLLESLAEIKARMRGVIGRKEFLRSLLDE